MDLAAFLYNAGADLSGILASAQNCVGVGEGDTLLAVGSLVEGLGNSRSDVDLLLITPRPLPAGEVAVVGGRFLADLQVLPEAQLEALLTRFEDWAAQPWDVSRAARFTLEERRLLHRLLNGTQLFSGSASRFQSLQPRREHVARLKLQIARHMARTIQVDMAGYRDILDYESLAFSAQDLLGQGVDALLASHLLTNPTPKWRSRLLARLPEDWERALPAKPTGAAATHVLWTLHRLPEEPARDAVLAHALRVATFTRAVFVYAERVLVRETLTPARGTWSGGTDGSAEPLPHLDFDIDFLEQAEAALVGRLNAFDEPLEVSAEEFALILLFDGRTTTEEALGVVWGHEASAAERRLIEEVAARVSDRGLAAQPARPERQI